MKLSEIINFLEKKYPKENAFKDDFIGLQIKGNLEINNILIALDLTNDVLQKAISEKIDLIIIHHPFFFGLKEELLMNKKSILFDKYNLLNKHKINVYVIHTNIDFAKESLVFFQAKKLNCNNITEILNSEAITANLNSSYLFKDFKSYLREKLDLLKDGFKDNVFNDNFQFKKLILASGASGNIIQKYIDKNALYIIGEVKHHEWIFALDSKINLLEIGHQSEKIFIEITYNLLSNSNFKLNKIVKFYDFNYKNN